MLQPLRLLAGIPQLVHDPLGVLAQQAQAAYAGAVTAQRAGDWATYGSQLKQLERILQALDGAAAAAEAPPE